MTPTPLDTLWLRRQLVSALAGAPAVPSAGIQLRRDMVEMLMAALDRSAAPTPDERRRYDWTADDLRPAVHTEMQRLQAGGKAPSKGRWDEQRDRRLPTASHCCSVLGVSWSALAIAAGLAPQRFRADAPDLDDLFPGLPPAPPESDAPPEPDGLPVVRTRTERHERPEGTVIVEYHLLR